jgi:hypothetical protein
MQANGVPDLHHGAETRGINRVLHSIYAGLNYEYFYFKYVKTGGREALRSPIMSNLLPASR